MTRPSLYPRARVVKNPGNSFHMLFLGKVRQVNATAGTCRVQLAEASQPVDAAVMTAHGNAASGWVWLPQEGDLVVVALLQGHKALPVILGSLYSEDDALPDAAAGACTLKHQSGTVVSIQSDGSLLVTGKAGATLAMKANGDVELKHATNNGDVLLDSTGATVSQGNIKLHADSTHILLDANSGGGGAKIELLPTGAINITPGAGNLVNLANGSSGVVRAGDSTSSPFGGAVADHFHVMVGGSTKVVAG